MPGSIEYYRSWAFRVRKREGRVHVPGERGEEEEEGEAGREQGHGDGQEARRSERPAARPSASDRDSGHGDDMDNDNAMDVDVGDTTASTPQRGTSNPANNPFPKSLTLILTPSGARRADKARKRDLRARRAGRRMRSMQRMGGVVV